MHDAADKNDQSSQARSGKWILDPRRGDREDDQSATKQRPLLSIFGSLLAEISLPKLVFAWTLTILLPAMLFGLAPMVLTAWIGKSWIRLAEATGTGCVVVVLGSLSVAWLGWRPLFRVVEKNFWALNALAVQPGYAFWREALRHLVERSFERRIGTRLARMRAGCCAAAGVLLFAAASAVALAVWPATHWIGSAADLVEPHFLVVRTVANAIVVMSFYLAVAALVWGFAEAAGHQPVDLESFDDKSEGARVWRVAHLSDVHAVGERYGFRIESGRAGPRGNERLVRAMDRLAAAHATEPLDLVLVSGDMTDAGLSAEWAEFLDIVAGYPALAERMLILPGNHDINVVDRVNPARLDLPFSPAKTLRKLRALSAIAAVEGDRVRSPGPDGQTRGPALADALEPWRRDIEEFADAGGLRRSARLARLWDQCFPLILPPVGEHGLGVAILDSNADANFSFTNALGMISVEQARRLTASLDANPNARWIVALHHHLAEYPRPVETFSERIGTALINGAWFLRLLRAYAGRIVVMHGHRHIDWIGRCGRLTLISAPSPVMARPDEATHFYVHSLAAGPDGSIHVLAPQRIDVDVVTG
ncbi:MAG: metallophosphoesterase [Hyphomicrobiales bacterium]|nr:metallophosphoesterase [Hyphomicrobiales bacterium]